MVASLHSVSPDTWRETVPDKKDSRATRPEGPSACAATVRVASAAKPSATAMTLRYLVMMSSWIWESCYPRGSRKSPALAAGGAEHAPFEGRGRHHGRDDDHEHDGRIHRGVDDRLAPDAERGADRSEYQPHLAPRNHADPDRERVQTPPPDGQAASLLAEDRGSRERRRQREHPGMGEGAEVHAHAHQHEEHGYEQRGHRLQQLLHPPLAARRKVPPMHFFENEPGRIGADDGRQTDGTGRVRQREADHQRRGEEYALPLQAGRHVEEAGRDEDAQAQRPAKKQHALQEQPTDRTVGRRRRAPVSRRDDGAAHDRQDQEPQDVVDHG